MSHLTPFRLGRYLRTAPSLQKGNLLAFSPRQVGGGKMRRISLLFVWDGIGVQHPRCKRAICSHFHRVRMEWVKYVAPDWCG